ncbi:DegT/DnrJ/EryC1/StrS family aminotransferase [Micromonospora sp. NPDC050397]|uniref:DegT/DnrJ/EryC1/StrS family aminotransferase n=1 Tax=Micromonospora sp. NPDC050397 TaxID=3364279 RepID=UPI00384E9781
MTLAIDGGTPVRREPFPAWPYHDDTERAALIRALEQGQWWRAGGSEVNEFEREFADFHGAPAALAVSNGTHALELALELIGLAPGEEVIVPAFTFIATSNAVARLGGVAVPVDVDIDTYCLDAARLEAVRTPRTKAVIPVHMAGQVADMAAIGDWANRHGVTIIQDAAHAHGATWEGKRLGELGSVACFSFQNGKLMTAGEGGAVLLPDEAWYEEAFVRHSCGRPIGDRVYAHRTPSSNFRLNEFSAAVLRAQLARVAEQTARREARWRELSVALSGIDGVRAQGRDARCDLNPHYMAMFTLEHEDVDRALVVEALLAEGIPAFVNYPPVYRTPAFWAGPVHGLPGVEDLAERCPASEKIGTRGIWLHHRTLLGSSEDTAQVATALAKVLAGISTRQPTGAR